MLCDSVGYTDVPFSDLYAARPRRRRGAGADCRSGHQRVCNGDVPLQLVPARPFDELFHMDFKYFQVQNKKIAISQITSVSENELNGIRDKMLDYMEDYLKTSGLSMQFVMLTDIIEEKTELLYVGRGAKNLVHTAFRKECGEHSVVLPGVVSRKKQMVTPLLSAMEEEGTM